MKKPAVDPALLKARELFAASGMSLDELGRAMGAEGEVARKSAWQFLNKVNDPKLGTLRRFAEAVGVPLAELVEESPTRIDARPSGKQRRNMMERLTREQASHDTAVNNIIHRLEAFNIDAFRVGPWEKRRQALKAMALPELDRLYEVLKAEHTDRTATDAVVAATAASRHKREEAI